MKALFQISALAVAIVAPIGGLAAYDRAETSNRYQIGTDWNGDKAVYHYEDGRLFRDDVGENIGYFYSGQPRLVAFGCKGYESTLIALEESDLPECARIEPITGRAQALKWSR
jgi:hypothetical protein